MHRAQFGPSQCKLSLGLGSFRIDLSYRRTLLWMLSTKVVPIQPLSLELLVVGKGKNQRDSNKAITYDVHRHTFPNGDSKQQRVDIMLVKDRKRTYRELLYSSSIVATSWQMQQTTHTIGIILPLFRELVKCRSSQVEGYIWQAISQ